MFQGWQHEDVPAAAVLVLVVSALTMLVSLARLAVGAHRRRRARRASGDDIRRHTTVDVTIGRERFPGWRDLEVAVGNHGPRAVVVESIAVRHPRRRKIAFRTSDPARGGVVASGGTVVPAHRASSRTIKVADIVRPTGLRFDGPHRRPQVASGQIHVSLLVSWPKRRWWTRSSNLTLVVTLRRSIDRVMSTDILAVAEAPASVIDHDVSGAAETMAGADGAPSA